MALQIEGRYYATGRRKGATARVWLTSGKGNITVNKQGAVEYFKRDSSLALLSKPLELTELSGKMDVICTVKGGGLSGQAGALQHGISRALCEYNPELRSSIKKAGMLTRDSRVKERKKPGQPGARKRFQFSKR
jgi:small subunit ribosomal protein S9